MVSLSWIGRGWTVYHEDSKGTKNVEEIGEKGTAIMAKLNYQGRPAARPESEGVQFSEFKVPLILLVIGLLAYGVLGMYAAGPRGAALTMGFVFLVAAVQTVLGIVAAYATAMILKTSFGELRSAVVKLAAVIVFSSAVALLPMGWIFSLIAYFGLLVWMFGLEIFEAFVFSVILVVLRMVVVMGLVGMLR